jgi:hypothetical protein
VGESGKDLGDITILPRCLTPAQGTDRVLGGREGSGLVLARGEADIRVVPAPTGSPSPPLPALVIAVALDPEERARIAREVDDVPTLLVSRPEDALPFLVGATPAHRTADDAGSGEPPEPDPDPGLTIDSDARVACWDDNRVPLSPLEHDLLRSLCEVTGHIRTFEWLQEHVWGNDHPGNRSHVQSVVKRLRRKLRQIGTPLQIDAVRGVGLRVVTARPPQPPA